MRWLGFALRRQLTVGFLAVLLLGVLLLTAAAGVDRGVELLPCGILNEDDSVLSQEIAAQLQEQDFRIFDTRQALVEQVRAGMLDCGMVLLPGLEKNLRAGSMDGAVLAISSPMSFLTELYKAKVMAVLFTAETPTLTFSVAQNLGWDTSFEEIDRRIQRYYQEGARFTFQAETVDGTPVRTSGYGKNVLLAAAAIWLFTAILPGICLFERKNSAVCSRIGRKAFRLVQLPTGLSFGLLCWLSAAVPLAVFAPEWVLPCLGYCCVLAALGLLLSRILRVETVCALLPIWLLASLALCPIFTDLAAVWPWLARLRCLLPPCWFFQAPEHPLLWLAAGAVSVLLAVLLAEGGAAAKQKLKRRCCE